jgi:hypothetical protein
MKSGTRSRDVRLDAIRGLLLILMAGFHVPTPVSHFLQEPFGFMSEAEGFIFLSACLAGFAYGKTYWQADWTAMSRRVWNRAGKIYFIHLAVIVPVVLIAWLFAARMTPLANHFHDFLVHPWGALALIPLLLHQPPLFDILPLYIIFLLATPWLLAIARRRGWGIVLVFSAIGWLAAQFNLGTHIAGDPSRLLPLRWGSFNFPAWQLVWVSGLAFGETALHRPLLTAKSRFRVGVISGSVVLAGLVARHGFFSVNPDCYLWMDKWTLGPLRLLNFAAWVGLLLAWNPRVPAAPLAPLALLGRHSLAVFSFHLPLVIAASTVVQVFELSPVEQSLVGLLVMAALFPWAAWLEHDSHPPVRVTVATPVLARRLSLRAGSRSADLLAEVPLRPLFPRVRASARIVHA